MEYGSSGLGVFDMISDTSGPIHAINLAKFGSGKLTASIAISLNGFTSEVGYKEQ
jgi:hypothetical protein